MRTKRDRSRCSRGAAPDPCAGVRTSAEMRTWEAPIAIAGLNLCFHGCIGPKPDEPKVVIIGTRVGYLQPLNADAREILRQGGKDAIHWASAEVTLVHPCS